MHYSQSYTCDKHHITVTKTKIFGRSKIEEFPVERPIPFMIFSVFVLWRCAAAQFHLVFIVWMWLVELEYVFTPCSESKSECALGNRAATVDANNSYVLFGFSVIAPDPQVQIE